MKMQHCTYDVISVSIFFAFDSQQAPPPRRLPPPALEEGRLPRAGPAPPHPAAPAGAGRPPLRGHQREQHRRQRERQHDPGGCKKKRSRIFLTVACKSSFLYKA